MYIGRNSDLRLLGAGCAGNACGSAGEQVATGLLVYAVTGSSAWVGVALAMHFAPMLLVGVPGGALADRSDRRRLIIVMEYCIAAVLGGYGWLLKDPGPVPESALWLILVVNFLSGCARAMHYTVRISYTWDIVGGEVPL